MSLATTLEAFLMEAELVTSSERALASQELSAHSSSREERVGNCMVDWQKRIGMGVGQGGDGGWKMLP